MVILGPTASGKTRLAVDVSAKLDGEIISADSRQVYRSMNIGTGKDLEEYNQNGVIIPHHLIDIADAGQKYNVSLFQRDFELAWQAISVRNRVPVVCGGTGLYIDAVLRGYGFTDVPADETLRGELTQKSSGELIEMFDSLKSDYQQAADTSTRKRLIRAIEIALFLRQNPGQSASLSRLSNQYPYICFGLNPAVSLRRERISRRLYDRLDSGLIEEVQDLMNAGLAPEQLIYYGLEYKYVTNYLTEVLRKNEMIMKLETEIHRFAKRQMTFFRKMEKDGIVIHWLDDALTNSQKSEFIYNKYLSFSK